jgi:lipoate-protein ligase A
VERERGSGATLHARSAALAASGTPRTVRVLEVDRPALVLGSGQPDSTVDRPAAEAAGVDVVRRRSGGAAVLVTQGTVVWVDLLIAAGDPLWVADVGKAMWWVGEAWAAAVDRAGAGPAQVWRSAPRSGPWSGRVCFGGVGSGEVLVGGKKVVGVSQRRTRQGALFQTAALVSWDPGPILQLLALECDERAAGVADLEHRAAGVGAGLADAVVDALIGAVLRHT